MDTPSKRVLACVKRLEYEHWSLICAELGKEEFHNIFQFNKDWNPIEHIKLHKLDHLLPSHHSLINTSSIYTDPSYRLFTQRPLFYYITRRVNKLITSIGSKLRRTTAKQATTANGISSLESVLIDT